MNNDNATWEELKDRNKELLLLHLKLHEVQQSCWGRFFRFQNSTTFKNFQKKYRYRGVFQLRLDDILYMILLLIIVTTFAFLPSNNSHLLTVAYRHFLVFLYIFSMVWMVSPSGYRHFINFALCIIFPTLILLVYKNFIKVDQTDTSTSLFDYGKYLTLWIVYGALYMTYPLKQFIRNRIGSLYSFLFALSFLTLFFIWPAYSLLEEFIENYKLTFNFIIRNRALLITFLTIIVFSFHLLTHSTFFGGNIKKTRQLLHKDFTKGTLTKALQQTEGQSSFIYRNFESYTRLMSGLILVFTLTVEIYVFVYLSNNLEKIVLSLAVMGFGVAFLVYGCIINLLNENTSIILMFFSIISVVPAFFSFSYYKLNFYQYIFLACALPYSTIFWCIVRSLSPRRPFLKLNILVVLYVFFHIPITLFIVNSMGMVTSNEKAIKSINYSIIGISGFVSLIGLVGFILWLCFSVKQLPAEQKKQGIPVNYNYHDETDPPYVLYKKSESFSLAWLGSLDIRNLAQIFCCIVFICCELSSIFVLNEINNKFVNKQFAASSSPYVIYAQFLIAPVFFIFSFAYINLQHNSNLYYVFLSILAISGIAGIIVSYVAKFNIALTVRLNAAFNLLVFALGIGLLIIKKKNKQIINFLGGVLIMFLWIFFVIPYAFAIPIVSIYISPSKFGEFVYYVILSSTLLLILLVSFMSLIFNVLMNKFQQEKKIKFMTDDVRSYLNDQGINIEDDALHIFYEAFENRDEKFVYFMRRGYPVRLFKQKDEKNQQIVNAIVYHNQEQLRKASEAKMNHEQHQQSACWACLTCCCGEDEEETANKVARIINNQGDQQLQKLVPDDFMKNVFISMASLKHKQKLNKFKTDDPTNFYSSQSITLKNLHKQARQLGPQYSLLKIKKTKKLAIDHWHQIFKFFSNNDHPPNKIIYNDFQIFCNILDLKILTQNTIRQIYFNFAKTPWKNILSLSIGDFALAMQDISAQVYDKTQHTYENQTKFLIDIVYPKLCDYSQFQDIVNEKISMKRISKQKKSETNISLIHENSFSQLELKEIQLEQSPFYTSFDDYKMYSERTKDMRDRLRQKRNTFQRNKLIQPIQQEKQQKKQRKVMQEKVKQKSCKRKIFEKYIEIKNCCDGVKQDEVVKRVKTKPWDYLSVEAIRLMEHKEMEWRNNTQEKQFQFRCIANNIMIAILKLADIYTYLEITLMNPIIGWQSFRSFTYLIIQYRYQFYIALGLVIISFVLGTKGIGLIFQDRLGLTETRVPASFPHPMFIFTFIYKLLILSLFNTIIITLFSTFVCNWNTDDNTFVTMINQGGKALQCFSAEHNFYLMAAILAIFLYYPMSSYTMPNFQFAEKRLDLKFKPSYLIIYFQVNFIISAGKVLLSLVNTTKSFQVFFQIVNISTLFILSLSVIFMQPCLIAWFNVIQLLVAWTGLIWNVMGLVLLLTGKKILCYIIAGSITLGSFIFGFIFIRRRYIGNRARVEVEADVDEIAELEMGWKYKKQYNVGMVRYNNQLERDKKAMQEKQRNIKNEEDGNSIDMKTNHGSKKNIRNQQIIDFDDKSSQS